MATVITFPARQPCPAGLTLREQIEVAAQAALDTADRLIALLDDMDGNPDDEDGGDDEPSLGAPEDPGSQIVWFRSGDRDLETVTSEIRL